jgi:hypothetical protein
LRRSGRSAQTALNSANRDSRAATKPANLRSRRAAKRNRHSVPVGRKKSATCCILDSPGTAQAGGRRGKTAREAGPGFIWNCCKSTLALSRDPGVQYKTSFALVHKLREAMASELNGLHVGGSGHTAEIDCGYFGGYTSLTR